MGVHLTQLPELKGHMTAEETALLIDEIAEGNQVARALFREAWVYTDMPNAFTAQTNVALVPRYTEATPKWGEFAKFVQLPNFKKQAYKEIWPTFEGGGMAPRENGRPRIKNKAPRVPANTEYQTVALDTSSTDLFLHKYGLRFPITWEMIINDELDTLSEFPEILAVYMRLLEDILQAEAFINDNGQGPRGGITRVQAVSTVGFAPGTPINPPLSEAALANAVQQLINTEVHGQSISIGNVRAVIPKQLELLFKQIVGVTTRNVNTLNEEGTAVLATETRPNPVAGMPYTVLDPLTDVDISASAATTWYLVATVGGAGAGRPGVVQTGLRGHNNPELFIANPGALLVGGGQANWKDGGFRNDSIEYKVRHSRGAGIVFGEGVVVSRGTGVAG